MKIGYARVSTPTQNLDRQLDALRAEGCDRIFAEKASGKDLHKRPELERALNTLAVDDILVVAEWDRATRSLFDGLEIIKRIHDRRALLKVLDRPIFDLTTATNRGLIALLSGIAEDERRRIVKRAAEGQKAATKRGVKLGRSERFPKGSQTRMEIEERLAQGESSRSIGRAYGCSHKTVTAIAAAVLSNDTEIHDRDS